MTADDQLLAHGGDLARAEARYGRPADGWLDLSTGINPNAYPVDTLEAGDWQRLPELGAIAALAATAGAYFGTPQSAVVVPTPGTQAAIQALPFLRPRSRVAVVAPAYAEHAHCWRRAGHHVEDVAADAIPADADVVVVVNPNNPDGRVSPPDQLTQMACNLASRGGWLVVDEAFADTIPNASVAPVADRDGLIVLRSFGKFFGLAGLRLGFVLSAPALGDHLAERLGPWAVSGPAATVGQRAYADETWITGTRQTLEGDRRTLDRVLAANDIQVVGGTDLFRLVRHPVAARLQGRLARHGIWTRIFDRQPDWMRIGLPGGDGLTRLDRALALAMNEADAA